MALLLDGILFMAKKNALIKKLLAVETLGFDHGDMYRQDGDADQGRDDAASGMGIGPAHPVTGVGYSPEGSVDDTEGAEGSFAPGRCAPTPAPGAGRIGPFVDRRANRLAHPGRHDRGVDRRGRGQGGHRPSNEEMAKTPRVAEFPFDSDRKLMSTVHRLDGAGTAPTSRAHPRNCWPAAPAPLGGPRKLPLTDALRTQITAANDAMAGQALRVLGVGYRAVSGAQPAQDEAERDLVFLGLVGMLDPPRPEVSDAVAQCRNAGIRVIMVTGDYGLTAEAIARKVGIVVGDQARVVSGAELEQIDDAQLQQELAENWEIVFARVKPEHKMRVVSTLKDMGEIVAVTGDGVNDAPALKRADIGVAMGVTGTDVAREAAVMVLLDDSFASIVAAVELGRSVYQNIRKFLIYLFSHNIAELTPILWELPRTSRWWPSPRSRSWPSTSGPTSCPPWRSGPSHPSPASWTARPGHRRSRCSPAPWCAGSCSSGSSSRSACASPSFGGSIPPTSRSGRSIPPRGARIPPIPLPATPTVRR